MVKLLTSLTKAAVAVAVTPVAVAIDVVTLPESALTPGAGPFDLTTATLRAAANNVKKAIE